MTGLKLFKDLFVGRTDAYGYGNLCIKQQLTDEVYHDHILGNDRIGVYPNIEGSKVKWCAVDIDEDSFEKVLNVYNDLKSLGLYPYIERSKSKGFHIWIFFNEWVVAVKVRLIAEMILKKFEYKFEVFPKQDEVEVGRFGNFIFLPFFGGSVIEDRTVFIDTENKIRIAKMEELHKIKLTPIKQLDKIISDNNLVRESFAVSKAPTDKDTHFFTELPCVENMKKGAIAGHRNEVSFRLAIHMKETGLHQDEAVVLMADWNSKNQPPLPESELDTTITSVYAGNYKSYGCETPIIQHYCDKTNCPMIRAQDKQALAASGVIVLMFRNEETMVFRKKDYEYRLNNFEFTKSGKFKSTLTLSKDNTIVFKDSISLDKHSHRKRFVDAAGKDEELDNDLIKLEELIRTQIEKEEKEKLLRPKQLYIMTETEKNEALDFLKEKSDILYQVINATNRMGIVGENILRVMVYLCFTSRITEHPLSITVKGESSSGKSFACQLVKKLIPEEGMFFITRATENALYHIQEDGLQHKIVYINELPGSESADYSIRSAQSERDLTLMIPRKDPTTGVIETDIKIVKGPVGFLLTTTKAEMFDENETRNFSLYTDDSPSLTKEIGKITIRKAQGELFELSIEEINLFKNVQRLLNPDYKIIIPFAEEIFTCFPEKPVRIRRDRERFRVLIEIVTLLHQYHREHREDNGKIVLVATLADYFIAKRVGESMLLNTIYEVGPASKQVWDSIMYLEETYDTLSIEPFTFTYQDVSDLLEWKYDKTKKWIRNLLHAGLIMYADNSTGGRGKTVKFQLLKKTGKDKSTFGASFLPEIEDLYDKYPCDVKLFYDPFTDETPDFLEDIRLREELEKE